MNREAAPRGLDPAHKALARKALIGVAGVGLVAALGVGLYNAIFDGPPKFARVVAEDLPADAVGMIAFAKPAHTLGLFDAALDEGVRAELGRELGFDPFSSASYADLGFDAEAPVGVAFTDLEHEIFVITIGLSDADKARRTIRSYSEKAGIQAWEEREFEGVAGMWRAQPAVAVLFRGDRMLVVASDKSRHAKEVERAAEELATLRPRDSLATTSGFRSIHRFRGEPIMFGFLNAEEIVDNPMAAATIGSSDVEAMAMALTRDDREIHMIFQTIVAKDSSYMKYLSGSDRSAKPLDRVPGPVYAGFHWSIDPDYFRTLFDQLGGEGKSAMAKAEREAERELGVSFERDIFDAWTGEFGILWTGAGEDRWGGLLFAGVRDESAAEATLERVWSRTHGADRRSTDAGQIFTWDERPPARAKIWDGYVWLGIGGSRIDEVDRDAKGFRKTTEIDAIADLVKSSSPGVAFVDLIEVRRMVRKEVRDGKALDAFADVIDPLEAVTMHASVDGRTLTWTMTLHTTVDDAYDTLLKRLIADLAKQQGDAMFDELIPRKSDCRRAVDNIIMVRSWESEQQAGDSLREELLDKCMRGEFSASCAYMAFSQTELERCGVK